MNTALVTLGKKIAERFDMGGSTEVVEVLKATAFKGPATDAQLTALLIVANQYTLNPFTREIFAFPDKNNGIVPVVGVDGWSRIINQHPQFDGMDFEQDDKSCTCIIFRKDRRHPTRVTEWMTECMRTGSDGKAMPGPWKSHPRRMLRHKAMIQCARLAFGFVGIYEQDEAECIVEVIDGTTGEIISKQEAPRELPLYTDAQLEKNLPAWQKAIDAGKTNAEGIIAKVTSGYSLTPEQTDRIRALKQWQPSEEDLAEIQAREIEESRQGEQQ